MRTSRKLNDCSAVAGVATFSTLTVDRGSLGYRLEAAASSLTVQSDLFNVRCVAILDSVTAPVAAYSLRKLRSAYAGSAFRARRTDGTQLDIGFDSVGCEFDKAALLTFAGTGDAFIHTSYDQQNNGKSLVQTTLASQPRIVVSGALEEANSRPVVRFRGSEFLPASNALGIAGSGGFAYSLVLRVAITSSSYNIGISEMIIWANRPSNADRAALETSQSQAY